MNPLRYEGSVYTLKGHAVPQSTFRHLAKEGPSLHGGNKGLPYLDFTLTLFTVGRHLEKNAATAQARTLYWIR